MKPGSVRHFAIGVVSPTVGTVLDETRGIGQGFDFLRITLSFGIVSWHSIVICYGGPVERTVWTTFAGTLGAALLPAFFALSGFLVMGSAARVRSLSTFLSFRVLRILPALATEICLAAVVIGGLVTVLPARAYFTSGGFFRYFLNVSGRVMFTLPGVFQTNPTDTVTNASLWTIQPEITCYIFLALMLLSNAYLKPWVYCLVAAVLIVVNLTAAKGLSIDDINGPVQPYDLFTCFVFGNLLFFWRYVVPASRWLFLSCAAVGLWLIRVPGLMNISLAALSYCIVYLGTVRMPRLGLLSRGDYSYGIYLYGFPVQQLVSLTLPHLRLWWLNVIVALPFIIGFAMFSWHVIEAPTLSLKDRLKFLKLAERRWLGIYALRLTLATGLLCYGLILLHWSHVDASTRFSFKAHWRYVAVGIPLLALLVAGPRRAPASEPAQAVVRAT